MTKADITDAVYKRVGGFSKSECADLVDLVFETMKEMLGRGEQIKLSGFGKFVLRDKDERPGRNPQSGARITITGRRVVSFRASPVVKERLNGGAAGFFEAIHQDTSEATKVAEPAQLPDGSG
jgi:integration host factor subunit alpha